MSRALTALALFGMAFCCELLDSALGGGYGTIIVPVLLLVGYGRAQAVAAILFSEMLTGFLAAAEHHRMGNVRLARGSADLRAALLVGLLAAVGAVAAVVVGLEVDKRIVNCYVGVLIAGIGAYQVGRHFRRAAEAADIPTWKSAVLGTWGGVNKGISGGGFGPLVTGFFAANGLTRRAMGITSLAEGMTSTAGLLASVVFIGLFEFDWLMTLSLTSGALCSVTLAAWIVRRLPLSVLRPLVGLAVMALGIALLANSLSR